MRLVWKTLRRTNLRNYCELVKVLKKESFHRFQNKKKQPGIKDDDSESLAVCACVCKCARTLRLSFRLNVGKHTHRLNTSQ